MYQETQHWQIRDISICHQKCFPSSLSSRLGLTYISKTLEWFLLSENRFLFHVECDGKAIGYCGGFKSLYRGDGSTSGMIQYAMREAVKGILKRPYLLLHPEIMHRYPLILKNIKKRIFRSKKNITIANTYSPENAKIGLVVIGVLPEYRGKGCFELLMLQFEEECKKRKADKMILSVKADNARAIAAYKKVGWEISSQTKKSIEMFKMI